MTTSKKLLVIWNLAATAALIAVIVGVTSPASADVSVFSAQEPPAAVDSSSGSGAAPFDDGGDGSSATADDIIDSTTADALVSITTTGLDAAHTHICMVTASAEATFVADGTFIFGISLDAAGTTAASNRRIEMFNNPNINDDSFEEVSSTIAFAGLAGDHTFTFSARKSAATGGNLNVSASAMTAVCMKQDL
jgi:hypothetical protein